VFCTVEARVGSRVSAHLLRSRSRMVGPCRRNGLQRGSSDQHCAASKLSANLRPLCRQHFPRGERSVGRVMADGMSMGVSAVRPARRNRWSVGPQHLRLPSSFSVVGNTHSIIFGQVKGVGQTGARACLIAIQRGVERSLSVERKRNGPPRAVSYRGVRHHRGAGSQRCRRLCLL
jgi:hypothetical protein